MRNNIFISTGGFKAPAYKSIKKLAYSGIKNIELSGGTSLQNNYLDKLKNLKKHNVLIDLSGDFRLKSSKEYLKWYKKKHPESKKNAG